MTSADSASLELQFVEQLLADLRASAAAGDELPIEKRKLRSVAKHCGYERATRAFLERLHAHATSKGLYSEPPLDDDTLEPDDWVHFSTGPFPPDAMMFAREEHLRDFVVACLGKGVFRGLRLFKEGDRDGREYPLASGKRIDILCYEHKAGGVDGIVAIELKRETERGVLDQLIEYLDELKRRFPGRSVRGVIVSGREDRVGASLLSKVDRHHIDWYCYRAAFEKVG